MSSTCVIQRGLAPGRSEWSRRMKGRMRPAHLRTTLRYTPWLALFLAGIFLLGFNIGTGSVTSMAKAGATYGMSLLWTIVASCLATFFMISIYGRYTLVTGETALQAFRKHIHPAMGVFFIIALTAGVSGSVMGVMGIVADLCYEWSKTIVDGGTVGCILYLGNRRDLMCEHKNGLVTNLVLTAIFLFSIVTTSMGIKGVWQLITS